MTEKEYIFKFEDNWIYKGVLSAVMDNKALDAELGLPEEMFPVPENWFVEIIGFIWVNEEGIWNMKIRLKYPSGNKQAFGNTYGKDANETLVLQDMYRLPMVQKYWFKNKDGTLKSLIQLMKDNDLIASIQIIKTQ